HEHVLLAVVLHRFLPEVSMRSHDLIGGTAVDDSMHEREVFRNAVAHEILPFACEHAKPVEKLGIPLGSHGQPWTRHGEGCGWETIRELIGSAAGATVRHLLLHKDATGHARSQIVRPRGNRDKPADD